MMKLLLVGLLALIAVTSTTANSYHKESSRDVDDFVANIQSIVENIHESFGKVLSILGEKFQGIVEKFKEQLQALSDTVADAIQKGKEQLPVLKQDVLDRIRELRKTIGEAFDKNPTFIERLLLSGADNVLSGFEKLINQVPTKRKVIGVPVFPMTLEQIAETIDSFLHNVGNKIGEVGQKLNEEFTELKEMIADMIEKGQQAEKETIKQVLAKLESIQNYVNEESQKTNSGVVKFHLNTAKIILSTFEGVLKRLETHDKRGIIGVPVFPMTLEQIAETIDSFLHNVGNKIGEVGLKLNEKCTELKEMIADMIEKGRQAEKEAVNGVLEKLKSIQNYVNEESEKTNSGVVKFHLNTAKIILSTFEGVLKRLQTHDKRGIIGVPVFPITLEQVAETIDSFLRNVANKLGESGQKLNDKFTELKEAVLDMIKKGQQAQQEVIHIILMKIEEIKQYVNEELDKETKPNVTLRTAKILLLTFETLIKSLPIAETVDKRNAIDYLSGLLENLHLQMEKILEAAGAKLGDLSQKIKIRLEELRQKVTELIQKGKDELPKLRQEILDKLQDLEAQIDKAHDKNVGYVAKLMLQGAKILLEGIRKVVSGNSEVSGYSLEFTFTDNFSSLVGNLRLQFEKLFEKIGGRLGSLGDKIKTKFEELRERIKNLVEKGKEELPKLKQDVHDKIQDLLTHIDEALTKNLGYFADLILQGAKILLNGIKNVVDGKSPTEEYSIEPLHLGRSFEGFIESLHQQFAKLLEIAGGKLGNLGEKIKSTIQELRERVKDLVQKGKDEIPKIKENILSKVQELMAHFDEALAKDNLGLLEKTIIRGAKTLLSGFADILNGKLPKYTNLLGEAKDSTHSLFEEIISKIHSFLEGVGGKLGNVGEKIKTVISDLRQRLEDLIGKGKEELPKYIERVLIKIRELRVHINDILGSKDISLVEKLILGPIKTLLSSLEYTISHYKGGFSVQSRDYGFSLETLSDHIHEVLQKVLEAIGGKAGNVREKIAERLSQLKAKLQELVQKGKEELPRLKEEAVNYIRELKANLEEALKGANAIGKAVINVAKGLLTSLENVLSGVKLEFVTNRQQIKTSFESLVERIQEGIQKALAQMGQELEGVRGRVEIKLSELKQKLQELIQKGKDKFPKLKEEVVSKIKELEASLNEAINNENVGFIVKTLLEAAKGLLGHLENYVSGITIDFSSSEKGILSTAESLFNQFFSGVQNVFSLFGTRLGDLGDRITEVILSVQEAFSSIITKGKEEFPKMQKAILERIQELQAHLKEVSKKASIFQQPIIFGLQTTLSLFESTLSKIKIE